MGNSSILELDIFTKFGEFLSNCSQDIERKLNNDGLKDRRPHGIDNILIIIKNPNNYIFVP